MTVLVVVETRVVVKGGIVVVLVVVTVEAGTMGQAGGSGNGHDEQSGSGQIAAVEL